MKVFYLFVMNFLSAYSGLVLGENIKMPLAYAGDRKDSSNLTFFTLLTAHKAG